MIQRIHSQQLFWLPDKQFVIAKTPFYKFGRNELVAARIAGAAEVIIVAAAGAIATKEKNQDDDNPKTRIVAITVTTTTTKDTHKKVLL